MRTVAEEVADRLTTAIAIGEFLPGSRLPAERDMAVMLGVSRGAVREALGRLDALGIVEIRRGRAGGAFVRDSWTQGTAEAVRRTLLPRWSELEELLDLCGLMEGTVARAAAERRTDADLVALREALDAFREAASEAEEQSADTAFHTALRQAAGNPRLAALCLELGGHAAIGFPHYPWGVADEESTARAVREHEAILRAVEAGDAERAGTVAREHFSITVDIIRDALQRGLES
ncbi:FadR/GntR family transcriptional regulator [Streptomyces sp. NPDC090306]|uniref:FadR/GntR family transcriptional regulator n=1 Tax=Streptomyces sp. NPDC090306 TaxID=3365961 RepID=UPI0038020D57